MSRNVLLARITPAVSKRFATFDPANLGPDLSLSNSNQTVTFLTNGDSKNRTARCLYPLSSFTNYVEFLVYAAAGASPTLSGNCALGIVDASASLSTFVGGDAHGYGFLPAEGQIWTNNASSVTTSATCALGDIIGMQAIFTGSSPSLTFFKNGVQIGTINLPASGTWYIAASVGGATGSAMLVFMNAGQQTFQYNAQQSGWWIASPQLSAVNLASEDFMALPTDTIPNDAYDGAINPTAGQSLHINRSVSFWPWRTTTAAVSGAQSYGNITIDDPSANYDALILNDVRDSQITVKRTQVGGSVNSAANLCLGIIDSVIGDGDFNKIISLKDNLAVLDGIFQHALFLPNADTSIAGKPRPALLGAGRSLPGVLFNSATNAYAISDASMYQLASVRVAGKSLTLSTDYSVSADGTSLILVNPPAGVLTCDASSGSNAVPASATDILSGNGNFASFTTLSQVTANWTLTRGGGSLLAAIPSFSTAAGHGQIVYPQTGGFGYTGVLQSNTNIIAANSIYAVDVIFDANLPNDEGSQQYSILVLDNYAWSSPTSSAGWGYFQTNAANPNPVPIGTAARLIIFNNTSSAVPLCLNFVNGPNSGAGSLNISNIKIYQLPNPTTAAPLNGLTLTQYMNLVMQHGGIAGTAWSQADTQAIDTATGYSSLGNYITQAITMRNAL